MDYREGGGTGPLSQLGRLEARCYTYCDAAGAGQPADDLYRLTPCVAILFGKDNINSAVPARTARQ